MSNRSKPSHNQQSSREKHHVSSEDSHHVVHSQGRSHHPGTRSRPQVTSNHQAAGSSQNNTRTRVQSNKHVPRRSKERGSHLSSGQASLHGSLGGSQHSKNSGPGSLNNMERRSVKKDMKKTSQEAGLIIPSIENNFMRDGSESGKDSFTSSKSIRERIDELQLPGNIRTGEESFFHLATATERPQDSVDEPLWLKPKAPHYDPENTGEAVISVPSLLREDVEKQQSNVEDFESLAGAKNKETQYDSPTKHEAVTHFTFGILSIICCFVCSIFSIKNSIYVKKYKGVNDPITVQSSSDRAFIYALLAVLSGMVIYMSLTAVIFFGYLKVGNFKGMLPKLFFPNDATI